jgi:hypothetical protein
VNGRAGRRRRRSAAGTGSASRPSIAGTRSTAGWARSDAQRLKSLEDENRRLKKLLAELMLDVAALKDLLAKN